MHVMERVNMPFLLSLIQRSCHCIVKDGLYALVLLLSQICMVYITAMTLSWQQDDDRIYQAPVSESAEEELPWHSVSLQQ